MTGGCGDGEATTMPLELLNVGEGLGLSRLLMLAIGVVHLIFSLIVFYSLRAGYEDLMRRSSLLVCLTAAGLGLHLLVSFANFTIFILPPWLALICTLLVVPLVSLVVPTRLIGFYGRFVFSRAIARASLESILLANRDSISDQESSIAQSDEPSNVQLQLKHSPEIHYLFRGTPVVGSDFEKPVLKRDPSGSTLLNTQQPQEPATRHNRTRSYDLVMGGGGAQPGRARQQSDLTVAIHSRSGSADLSALVDVESLQRSHSHSFDPQDISFNLGLDAGRGGRVKLSELGKQRSTTLVVHNLGERKEVTLTWQEGLLIRLMGKRNLHLLLYFLYFSPFIATYIADLVMFQNLNCINASVGIHGIPQNNYVIISFGLLVFLSSLIGAIVVRDFPDPFRLARECRWYVQYGGVIAMAGYILSVFLPQPSGTFEYSFITSIGLHIMLFISTTLQVILAMRDAHGVVSLDAMRRYLKRRAREKRRFLKHLRAKPAVSRVNTLGAGSVAGPGTIQHQVNVLRESQDKENARETSSVDFSETEATSNQESMFFATKKKRARLGRNATGPRALIRTLNDPKLAELFEEHLIGEFSVELLRMFMECRRFEVSYFDSSEATRRARAKRIAKTFVEVGSVLQVNLPDSIREDLLDKIFKNPDPKDSKSQSLLPPDLFKAAENEVLLMMDGAFMRFTETDAYRASVTSSDCV